MGAFTSFRWITKHDLSELFWVPQYAQWEVKNERRASTMGKGPTWSNSELSLILVWFSGKAKIIGGTDCSRLSESRCPNGAFLDYNMLQSSMTYRSRWWFCCEFQYCWILLDVAVHTWLCSSQSTIVVEVEPILNSPYCALLCEVSVSFWWRVLGRKHSKLRPCMTLCLFSNRLVMLWRGWGKKPRIIKDSRTPDVGGFAWLWSWGTFSYTIRWYLLFDWETRCVPVCWVYTNFSRQEHSFSDKA